MAFLQLIAVTLLAVAFCEDVPQGQASDGPTFLQRENYLLKLLLGHKDLKWNGNEVNGVRTVIEDIRAGKDPKAEVKEEFRQNLGSDIAQQLFDVGEQIMEAELEAKDQFQRDFNMNYHEKNALQKLEKDVVAGKDPLHESPKIMRRINKDGRKLFNLTPEDQDTEKALLTATYGEETAQQILDAIKVIREEVQAKASADADAEEAMKAEIGG
ncbi:PREDICTED: uncharacterized protein LOC109486809 isoform X2 [Branchiostoma belcheri]|uniref:Uncharacterized protein LOC109486809 isoform X2 n=1 Tax=Branchiostoma belcheri TaxID=7741 RepID=A0A6P5AT55_BRABE|nr:PREDICTED: uncharacterized protein LOC109486809 isoform X2 [Branchiostoma belcheri]